MNVANGSTSSSSPPIARNTVESNTAGKRVLYAVAWLVFFYIAFFSFELPNSNPKASRVDVWSSLHFLYLELIDPIDDESARVSGWRYFPQRLFPLSVALFLLAGAWGTGSLLLRIVMPRERLTQGEFQLFSIAVGLSACTLLVLICGLFGLLSRGLIVGVLTACMLAALALESRDPQGIVYQFIRRLVSWGQRSAGEPRIPKEFTLNELLKLACITVCFAFGLCMLLGAALPSIDFDVKEYHLQGPKEYFTQGQITFLPHNVYTSFPFLTEMLILLGMVLADDWWYGALAGQLLLMCFGPLTAWGVFLAARHWWGSTAGWMGLLIHMSTPWTYRISIIAYTEGGLSFYLLTSLFAALLAWEKLWPGADENYHRVDADISSDIAAQLPCRETVLAGFLSGSAMACKYPGVVSVVIPIAVFIIGSAVWACRRQRREGDDVSRFRMSDLWNWNVIQLKAWFGIGLLLAIGPWLAKNVAETGNPVYPLLYSVFGGVDLDAELNEKWKRGHSPSTYALSDLVEKVVDVTLKSDWLSPLLFGLAPLALLVRRRRDLSQFLLVYVAYLFLTWWLLTHRIDRFWVPLIPVVSLLAGVGISWSGDKFWIRAAGAAVLLAVAFNLGFITTGLCGYNAYLLDLNVARVQAARITSPELVLLNDLKIPRDQKVLVIGDAEVFDADFSIIYHTVFDRPILDDWWGVPQAGVTRDLWPQRDPREIQDELHARKIRFVYVNWMEILRYRMTYGYTDYVRPERFRVLERAGVLGENLPQNQAYARWESFRTEEQREIERWAPELIVARDGEKYFITSEIFPVR